MRNQLKSSGLTALSFTLSAGLLALALTPGISSAATTAGPTEVTVEGERVFARASVAVNSFDLTKASDLKRLNARIRGAIAEVCGETANVRMTVDESRCRDEARRSTQAQVAALRNASALAARGVQGRDAAIAVVAAR
jgi:UrcA family protein